MRCAASSRQCYIGYVLSRFTGTNAGTGTGTLYRRGQLRYN